MRRPCIVKSVVLMIAALLLLPGINGQQASSAPKNTAPAEATTTRRKLTSDQERGLRLLKLAEAQAGGVPAGKRGAVRSPTGPGPNRVRPPQTPGVVGPAILITPSGW